MVGEITSVGLRSVFGLQPRRIVANQQLQGRNVVIKNPHRDWCCCCFFVMLKTTNQISSCSSCMCTINLRGFCCVATTQLADACVEKGKVVKSLNAWQRQSYWSTAMDDVYKSLWRQRQRWLYEWIHWKYNRMIKRCAHCSLCPLFKSVEPVLWSGAASVSQG